MEVNPVKLSRHSARQNMFHTPDDDVMHPFLK